VVVQSFKTVKQTNFDIPFGSGISSTQDRMVIHSDSVAVASLRLQRRLIMGPDSSGRMCVFCTRDGQPVCQGSHADVFFWKDIDRLFQELNK
jgi:hypothetical protein